MTTVDAMADEIMKGLTEYADLADTSMKKAVRKTAKSVKDDIPPMLQREQVRIQKAGLPKRQRKTAILLK